jgi:hypothetical protein
MLKTALAFVVINSRSKKRALTKDADASSNPSTRNGNHHRGNRIMSSSAALPSSPIFNGLFNKPSNAVPSNSYAARRGSREQEKHGSGTVASSMFLHSIDDEDHTMHIFRAARSLAKTFLAQKRQRSKMKRHSAKGKKRLPNDDVAALTGTTVHLAHQLQQFIDRQKNRVDVKSSAPVSGASKSKGSKRSHRSKKQPAKKLSPHAWIRKSLLETIYAEEGSSGGHSLKDDTLDMIAAFHIYQVMIPQIASRYPSLFSLVFQVATTLVRDLYDDKVAIPRRTNEGLAAHKRTMDGLATSALRLIETCLTVKTSSPRANNMLRSTMLSIVHTHLVRLTVPISSRDVPKLYRQLVEKKRLHRHQLRMEARILARQNAVKGSLLAGRPRYKRLLPRFTLDPGAKVLLRLAIIEMCGY